MVTANHAWTQSIAERKIGSVTRLPLPRFVSLKAEEVNARVGPGSNYAIAWVFKRAGLPVEILNEFESFRQVRESEGGTGWVAAALLSGRRTAVVAPWSKDQTLFDLTASRNSASQVVARIEAGSIIDISECDGQICEVYSGNTRGFLSQSNVWGVYAGERVK